MIKWFIFLKMPIRKDSSKKYYQKNMLIIKRMFLKQRKKSKLLTKFNCRIIKIFYYEMKYYNQKEEVQWIPQSML